MKVGDMLNLIIDGKAYTLLVTTTEDFLTPVVSSEPHALTVDEIPPYDHGASLYRGDKPCSKCSKFWGCCERGKPGSHVDCFVERNA